MVSVARVTLRVHSPHPVSERDLKPIYNGLCVQCVCMSVSMSVCLCVCYSGGSRERQWRLAVVQALSKASLPNGTNQSRAGRLAQKLFHLHRMQQKAIVRSFISIIHHLTLSYIIIITLSYMITIWEMYEFIKTWVRRSKIVNICANKMTNWFHHPKLSTILQFRP